MKSIPSPETILQLLDRLNEVVADDLETECLDFKRWRGVKESMTEAVEMAVCFANAQGGMIVFGVNDSVRGRNKAVGCCDRYDLDEWLRGIYDRTRPNLTVEVSELPVPEGNLILVRVPKGPAPPYGTSGGLYRVRVGKNCMPYSPEDFQKRQVSMGAIDWSAQPVEGIGRDALDPTELDRLRSVLRANRPESPLLDLKDDEFLSSLGVLHEGRITRAGLLLLGRKNIIHRTIPNHEVIYLHHSSPMDLDFRLDQKTPLLHVLERLTEAINVRNPFKTLKTGLFHVDIPAFPEIAFREAILNALIHRDYLEPGSVYIRHADREMNISSPGGFIGGITPENVLHAEPKARNRLLAEIFQKIGLVERAGIGRRRIFIPPLAFGKRAPLYEADAHTVKLTLYDGSFDQELATFIGIRERRGESFDVIELLLLSFLREHGEMDVNTAARITQLPEARIRERLDQFCHRPSPWLERRGKKSGVTYHLARSVAAELIGKGVYSRSKAIDRVQWPALIRQYVEEHGSINNSECRELLLLGNSRSAISSTSTLLKSFDFLKSYGPSRQKMRYCIKN